MVEHGNRITRTSGMSTWRAGCSGTGTSGSEGGSQKPTGRKTSRALRPDPYTQQRTGEGWLYLAVVLDAFSRRIVGWSMADHLRTELVLDALDMAITQRNPAPGLVHHTDHGCPIHQPGVRQAPDRHRPGRLDGHRR
jgi:transposase InsO family protein